MPPHLLHQNLRTFGPGHAGIPWYPAGFAAVAGGAVAAGGPVEVVGLTEVVTASAATKNALDFIVGNLGGNTQVRGIVACGRMLGPNPEYVAIAVPTGVKIVSWGRVFLRIEGEATEVVPDEAPAGGADLRDWMLDPSAAPTADLRGIVYVVVTLTTGATIVAGFVHNVYTQADPRGLFMGVIWDMIDSMRADSRARAMGVTDVYLGGDFNVEPRNVRRGSRAATPAHEYWKSVTRNPPVGWGVPYGTTWGHHVLDYWYVGFLPNVRRPLNTWADGATMDAGPAHTISDHAASLIST